VFDNDIIEHKRAEAGMVSTFGTGASNEKECPRCGSLYEVRMVQLPIRDKDSFDCLICDHELDTWNGTTFPSYLLLKREPWPKP
jgi:transposase-like protein